MHAPLERNDARAPVNFLHNVKAVKMSLRGFYFSFIRFTNLEKSDYRANPS